MNIANAHLHCATARTTNIVRNVRFVYKETWDRWAQHLMRFNCRFFCGDFSMAAIEVIMQLRARGFCANLVSWYPWVRNGVQGQTEYAGDDSLRMDSVLIIAIGPSKELGFHLELRCSATGIMNPNPTVDATQRG